MGNIAFKNLGPGAAGGGNPGRPGTEDWAVKILVLATEILDLEDPLEISRRVVAALVEQLGLPVVSILLADDAGELAYAADYGVDEKVKALGFRRAGTAYTAFHTGEATFVEENRSDARANPLTRNLLGAYAALPIHHRGRAYGVIMVTFMEPHPFTPLERVTLATFAVQMGIALDNGRLHRRERQRIAFLAAQADFSEALSATLRSREVARILGDTLRATASCAVAVWCGDGRILELGYWAGFPEVDAPRPSLEVAESRVLAAAQGDGLAQIPLAALVEDFGPAAPVEPLGAFAMPLLCSGSLEGLLVLLAEPENLDAALVRSMGERTAFALHNARLFEASQAAASIDPLTGLLNRRAFRGSACGLVARAHRGGTPASVIMLDLDHFKDCNDTYGHPVGDKALVLFAQILRNQVRPTDLVGRLGGEEFAVALQGATRETAFIVAERIRGAMAAAHLDLGQGNLIPVPTVSLGLADLAGTGAADLDTLLDRADAALYRAKEEGRNRTCGV